MLILPRYLFLSRSIFGYINLKLCQIYLFFVFLFFLIEGFNFLILAFGFHFFFKGGLRGVFVGKRFKYAFRHRLYVLGCLILVL